MKLIKKVIFVCFFLTNETSNWNQPRGWGAKG